MMQIQEKVKKLIPFQLFIISTVIMLQLALVAEISMKNTIFFFVFALKLYANICRLPEENDVFV